MTIAWAIIIVAILFLLDKYKILGKTLRRISIAAGALILCALLWVGWNYLDAKWQKYKVVKQFSETHDCLVPSTGKTHPVVAVSEQWCQPSEAVHDKSEPVLRVSCDLSCDWKLDGKPQGRITKDQSTAVSVSLGRHTVNADSSDGIAHVERIIDANTASQIALNVELVSIRSERLSQYYAVYQNQDVIYLRRVFNGYLAGQSVTDPEGDVLLEKWDRKYYLSKFVVLSIEKGELGGVWITLMFQDQPDRMFRAWVLYGRLAALDSPYRSEQDIGNVRTAFDEFLTDKEHAL